MKCIDCGYCRKYPRTQIVLTEVRGKEETELPLNVDTICQLNSWFLLTPNVEGECPNFISKSEFDEIEKLWEEHINAPFENFYIY